MATTIVTFLPAFGLEGSEGKLFGPLAWAKTLAMFGSVVVAIILVPALSTYLLQGKLRPVEKNKVSHFIIRTYKPALNWMLENRKIFIIFPMLIFILGIFAFSKLGKEFMPNG